LPLSDFDQSVACWARGRDEFSLPLSLVARFSSRDLFATYRADQAGVRPVDHSMAQLSCPKCDAPLRRFERSGVVIERCTHCRGVFLDRGELEHLIEMEGALLYDPRPGTTGRPITDDNPTRRVRAGGKRKIPVTERILDLG
jgi:Zn-finger nucleic acid-binding protein